MKTKTIISIISLSFFTSLLFGHSRAVKPEYVDMLLKPYFELQASLSKDNLDASKNNANSLKLIIGKGPSFEDAPSLLDLQDQATNIANAPSLKDARTAFLTLSTDLAEMIEHVGTSGKHNVFQMNCPMAFEGKGGDWMQNSKDLANPYYGSMMYTCGSVKAQLAKGKSHQSGEGEHDGHKGHGEHKH
jgi:Cu(I)/Ag(I) efflux system membrane fusion protein